MMLAGEMLGVLIRVVISRLRMLFHVGRADG